MKIRAILAVAMFCLGCVGDAPTTSDDTPDAATDAGNNTSTTDAGDSDMGPADAGTDSGEVDMDDEVDMTLPGVAYGGACDDDNPCQEGLDCSNLGGTAVCANSCESDDDCASGPCAAGQCWPNETSCGSGGSFVIDACAYESSCQVIFNGNPGAESGHYVIEPPGGPQLTVWCEMDLHGGALTIAKVEDPNLTKNVESHVNACRGRGMEPIIPPSRAGMQAIVDYLGSPPPVVDVRPRIGIRDFSKVQNYRADCKEGECVFYLSDDDSGSCNEGQLVAARSDEPLRLAASTCALGSWTNTGDVLTESYTVCAVNDFERRDYASCLEILDDGAVHNTTRGHINGPYALLRAADSRAYGTFCEMEYEGGGWTLAGKINGEGMNKYDADFWRTSVETNLLPIGLGAFESRSPAFQDLPATQIRVSFMNAPILSELESVAEVIVPADIPPLLEVFDAGTERLVTTMTRESWAAALQGTFSLQPNCNKIGFNLATTTDDASHSVRLGILGDQTDSCADPDSSIGVGISGTSNNPDNIVAGNAAPNVNSQPFWVSLWVRDVTPRASCDAHRQAGLERSGTYPINAMVGIRNQSCTF